MKKKTGYESVNYTPRGFGAKILNSPDIKIYPDEWKHLDKIAESLEEKLDTIRTYEWRGDMIGNLPITDEGRKIIKQLSEIDREMRSILMNANPEYAEYWYENNY